MKKNNLLISKFYFELLFFNRLSQRILFFLFFILFFHEHRAQEVNLEVAGKRQIESFYRILKPAKTIDSVIPISNIQYPLLSLKYKTSFELDSIKIAKVKLVEKLEPLKPIYLKAGLGNGISTLFDAYYGSLRSRKNLFTAQISHRGFFGSIPNYAPSTLAKTDLFIENKWIESKKDFQTKLYFSDFLIHQYGLKNTTIKRDSIKQRWNTIDAEASIRLKKKDTMALQHRLVLGYRHFREKSPESDSIKNLKIVENNLKLNSYLLYRFGKESINLNSQLIYNRFSVLKGKDSILNYRGNQLINQSKDNILLTLNPFIKSFSKDLKLKYKIGLLFALDYNVWNYVQNTKAYIYPDIEIKYSLFNDLFIPYLIIKGGLKQISAYQSSVLNPFIASNNLYLNENQIINSKVGFKGTFSDKISFHLSFLFNQSKNAAFFINDTLQSFGNEFSLVYDQLTQIGGEIALSYEIENNLKTELNVCYFNNQTKTLPFAWNLPDLTGSLRIKYVGIKNLTLQMEGVVENGRTALATDSLHSDGNKSGTYYLKLPIIVDFNFETQYQFYKNVSVFLQVNNFIAQRFQRWYNYPTMGIQVLGGLSIKL
ncbi:MAG: hypothetical protein HYU67_03055 [Flavobacteriia bacterium]|nr:hypothetical protein [Flavobacteriia bacterium]